jgi:RNA polymerase sigma-70 factor, ECF subfamily
VSSIVPPECPSDSPPSTLGSVLYAGPSRARVPETLWVCLVRSIAAGDQPAFRELYERTHRLVFTLIMRIVASRETAEELTLDVFHDVWRRAPEYSEEGGSVLGWIMNQARSRAIDRLRFEQRKKRTNPHPGNGSSDDVLDGSDRAILIGQQGRILRHAMASLTSHERQAIELAFFGDCTYTEVAQRLNEPVGTIKTRIRSGLTKLRLAFGRQEGRP